jgi:manganese/iron transport system substrate-binding protein
MGCDRAGGAGRGGIGRRAALGLAGALLLAQSLAPTATLAEGRPVIVVSFTVLGDLVRRVAGPQADVRVLAPVGAEVHEWELSARNFVDLEEADVVLVNGYMLEQWMPQIEETVGDGVPVVRVAEASGFATVSIQIGDFEGTPDPHLWVDPAAAAAYLAVIGETLAAVDPGGALAYAARAGEEAVVLQALQSEIAAELAAIPPARRLLVSSEAAFHYFARAFDLEHHGIWGSNAEVEGGPEQLRRIVDLIRQRQPAAVFFESTVTDRVVRAVAEDTGVAVAGPLFVDSVGAPGSGAETYADMLRANARLLVATLVALDQ